MFYLLSGAAASGKSSCVKMIKPMGIPHLECHDADEKVTRNGKERLSKNSVLD